MIEKHKINFIGFIPEYILKTIPGLLTTSDVVSVFNMFRILGREDRKDLLTVSKFYTNALYLNRVAEGILNKIPDDTLKRVNREVINVKEIPLPFASDTLREYYPISRGFGVNRNNTSGSQKYNLNYIFDLKDAIRMGYGLNMTGKSSEECAKIAQEFDDLLYSEDNNGVSSERISDILNYLMPKDNIIKPILSCFELKPIYYSGDGGGNLCGTLIILKEGAGSYLRDPGNFGDVNNLLSTIYRELIGMYGFEALRCTRTMDTILDNITAITLSK